MNEKVLEGFLKTALSLYRERYQERNPDKEIDFAIDFFDTTVNPKETAEKQGLDGSKVPDKTIPVTYMRIVKTVKEDEPRVIFASYQPSKGQKKPWVKTQLLRECLKHFVIGGVEYSEALFLYEKNEAAALDEVKQNEQLIDEPEVKSENA